MIFPDRITEQHGKITCCKCGKDAAKIGHWWNIRAGKSTCFKCKPQPKEWGER
jgi:hypothetical protein